MRGRRRLAVLGAVLGTIALVGAGCSNDSGGQAATGGGGGGTTATTSAPAATTAPAGGGEQELKLTAQGVKWSTTRLELRAGTEYTVEVTNKDTVEHSFTFKDAGADTDVEGGEDAKVTFTAPAAGSYEFHCKYHPSAMKGTVTVA